MFFAASKIVWAVLNPGNLLLGGLILGVLGLIAPWERARKAGRGLLCLVAAAALAIALLPVGSWLARPLEDRFTVPSPLPPRVDGVVVLGGGVDLEVSVARNRTELNRAGDRLTALIELARRYPEARLIYSGGNSSLRPQDHRDADFAARFLARMGLASGRLQIERESRNTRENARMSLDLAQPRPGEVWLLVTSATHMPRSVGIFRRLGWPVVPYPVDYTARDRSLWALDIDFARELTDLNRVGREWIGLIAYRLAGWTDTLLPGPGDP